MKAIEFNQVWKKFKKGEKLNSLRDFLPFLFKNAFKGNGLKGQEFWALQDVNFQVKKGEVIGLIGPNGAGKSTILKLLSGILRPNKGNMSITGRLSALIEINAGFHPELTGRENVYLNGTILGIKRKEIEKKFEEIVDFSGVKEFIDTPVKRYSSGMYSRLGFSVAAHMDPEILLVDEVLSVGDIAFQAKCAQKMRDLLSSNTTIVIVSHNLSLIESLCKRVILLDKGKIIQDALPDEVIPYYQNLIYNQQEEELRKKSEASDYKVKINRETILNIANVEFYGEQLQKKDNFNINEPINIKIAYEAKELIKNPIFVLDIIRSDGVICCSSNNENDGVNIDKIQGKGEFSITLNDINLTPGIYIAHLSIWDEGMLHPYITRKQDIIRINVDSGKNSKYILSKGVFITNFQWSFK